MTVESNVMRSVVRSAARNAARNVAWKIATNVARSCGNEANAASSFRRRRYKEGGCVGRHPPASRLIVLPHAVCH